MINKKFGKWTVLELHHKNERYQKFWQCECKCGNQHAVRQSDLRNGKSTQCKGCKGKDTSNRLLADLTGQNFGKWTVVSRHGTTKYRRPLWLCKCECGKTGIVQSGNLLSGLSTKCGKCNHYKDIKGRVWTSILNSAKNRNIEVKITIEEAFDIFKNQNETCVLTGRPIFFAEDCNGETTASLDRIDSTKPYTKENCQWLHKGINRMKWIYTNIEFIAICREVVQNISYD